MVPTGRKPGPAGKRRRQEQPLRTVLRQGAGWSDANLCKMGIGLAAFKHRIYAACSNNLIWSFDINSLSNPTAQWADCGRTNFVARGGFCAHNDMLFTVDSEAVWCRSLQKEAQWTKHSDGPPVQGKGKGPGGQKRAAAEPVVTFEGDVRALKQVPTPHPNPHSPRPSVLNFVATFFRRLETCRLQWGLRWCGVGVQWRGDLVEKCEAAKTAYQVGPPYPSHPS